LPQICDFFLVDDGWKMMLSFQLSSLISSHLRRSILQVIFCCIPRNLISGLIFLVFSEGRGHERGIIIIKLNKRTNNNDNWRFMGPQKRLRQRGLLRSSSFFQFFWDEKPVVMRHFSIQQPHEVVGSLQVARCKLLVAGCTLHVARC